MFYKNTIMLAVLLSCATFFAARADVRYTVTTTYTSKDKSTNGSATSVSQEIITYFVARDKKRVEYGKGNTVFASDDVRVTRCDLNQLFRIDNSLKIYTVSALDAKGVIRTPTKEELKGDIPTGEMVTHFSVQKIGTEKVSDVETTIFHVQIHTSYSGVLTGHESDYDGKMWVADVPADMTCDPPKFLKASRTQIEDLPTGKRIVTYKNTGDIDAMNAISTKLLLRQEGTTGDSKISENTTGYSTAKLDDSFFEIPPGYRKVSFQDYTKLRSAARIKAMRNNSENNLAQ